MKLWVVWKVFIVCTVTKDSENHFQTLLKEIPFSSLGAAQMYPRILLKRLSLDCFRGASKYDFMYPSWEPLEVEPCSLHVEEHPCCQSQCLACSTIK